ncbi:MAG TPA: hypothetical protein VMP01_11105 [Pirellulaceae bacterium]|nr:hypothetical protein [Pirellulaceae bacterium]
MVLFGSRRQGDFVLDTVFVVSRGWTYNRHNHRSLPVPALYHNAAIAPLDIPMDFRLYEGATAGDPVGGMFSFFPSPPTCPKVFRGRR